MGAADSSCYLQDVKNELQKEWPKSRTINIVFHGHSVPSGFFRTPLVNTMEAYPQLVLKKLKAKYPYAVVNIIVTAKGGENSAQGADRFAADVLIHRPDVIFIDYALNDRKLGVENAFTAWNQMIAQAKMRGIKVVLLTPSPDTKENYASPENELRKHSVQIRRLAAENQVGLVDSYRAFEFLYGNPEKLDQYMAQFNHPNAAGHELIAVEIMKLF